MPLAGSGWPVPDEARDGWWPGLPYPLHDMRPQGYMGRLFARAEHRALGVAPDPQAWSDDDVLHVLSQRCSDTSGCWIAGLDALSAAELSEMQALNRSYRERHGFPFIIAVRRKTKAQIFEAIRTRLARDTEDERAAALDQIGIITKGRIDALLQG